VYARARQAQAQSIVIATDDQRIGDAARAFGARVCMTRADHASGTDRLAEVIEQLAIGEAETVVNLQGDEPLMPAALIRQVAATLESHPEAVAATACHAIHDPGEFDNPNVVKVTFDHRGHALYFSRAPIPWPRDGASAAVRAYRHIGLYAYRAGFVRRFAGWPACELERVEQLEQLRVLWNGERIAVCIADEMPGPGVDTPDDLERVRTYFRQE
jgi:3-deoxy-manno-octulosonate cytidylyltransferase (CMP-KDO synthetase)